MSQRVNKTRHILVGLGSVWERPVGRRAEREVMVGGGEGWRRLGKEYLEVAVALPALLSGDFPSLPGLGLFRHSWVNCLGVNCLGHDLSHPPAYSRHIFRHKCLEVDQ